jgi:predicted RNA polymerase sigma factor
MARKMNPKSLKNLRMGQFPGRKTIYSQSKSRHGVTLTDDAWAGIQAVSDRLGVSVSELLERIGRNQLVVVELHTPEQPLPRVEDLQSRPTLQDYQTPTIEREGLLIFTSLPEADTYPLENAVELMREERIAQLLNGM